MYFGGVPHGCVKADVDETNGGKLMSPATRMTLGMHYAKALVRDELRAQGRRLQAVEAREISVLARGRIAEGLAMADARWAGDSSGYTPVRSRRETLKASQVGVSKPGRAGV
jgi:hypothetical protein